MFPLSVQKILERRPLLVLFSLCVARFGAGWPLMVDKRVPTGLMVGTKSPVFFTSGSADFAFADYFLRSIFFWRLARCLSGERYVYFRKPGPAGFTVFFVLIDALCGRPDFVHLMDCAAGGPRNRRVMGRFESPRALCPLFTGFLFASSICSGEGPVWLRFAVLLKRRG